MSCACIAAAAIAAALGESLADCGAARLKGPLGERLDAMVERHVAATDVDYITATFAAKAEKNRGWQTEFWGKWMHSAVPYAAYLERGESGAADRLRAKIDRGIDRILSSQEPNGYIGNYPDGMRCGEGWDVWGVKYTLLGLLHFHDGELASGNAERARKILGAAKRLCDFMIDEIGPGGRRGTELWQTGNWSGYASSSILEPVVLLYKRTKEKKYLDFATYIVKGMKDAPSGPRLVDLALAGVSVADRNGPGQDKPLPSADGNWAYVCKHGRGKAYEMMSCCQGLLEYADAASGEPGAAGLESLRNAVLATAADIVKEEINLAGGCSSSEAWYHGARKQHLPYMRLQETCVTTTWMRLCEKLLCETDSPEWADQIEKTFYNAYLAALKADGSEFAGYTPLSGDRCRGQHHCYMHTDCCNANGPRGFLVFLRELFNVRRGVPTFNFYASAIATDVLPSGQTVSFDIYTLYPRSGQVRLTSRTAASGPVRFRIPGWCPKAKAKLNGKTLDGTKPGAYFTIDRDWAAGDVVELDFEMPVVAHTLENHVAFTRGPVLLARDSRFADGDLAEVFRRGIRDGRTMTAFFPVRPPSDSFWMSFAAILPIGSHHENPDGSLPSAVSFCDYASAGNDWRRENTYRTWFPVELAPESR